MNHIVIMGRLTRDPELRETSNGTPVTSFTLAVDRPFVSKDGGERKTDFIDCVAWRNTAQFVTKYFTKGQMAAVAGRLEINDWTDKENIKRKKPEVVADHIYFTGSKGTDGGKGGAGGSSGSKGGFDAPDMTPVESSDFEELDEDDGDLPF